MSTDYPQNNSSHFDVSAAEREFHALERRLTNPAEKTAVQSRASTTEEKDVEKGEQPTHFNLRDYLSSSNDAHTAAGIQHKHVGVTWEDLQIDVIGGMGTKVSCPRVLQPDARCLTIPYRFTLIHLAVCIRDRMIYCSI